MTAALVLLDIDPNLVKPGWTALIVVILLALAMTGLFFSMRRQFRKLDANRAAAEDVEQDGTLPEDEETPVASAPAAEGDPQPDDSPAPRPGSAPTS
jgi:hypothetical protein